MISGKGLDRAFRDGRRVASITLLAGAAVALLAVSLSGCPSEPPAPVPDTIALSVPAGFTPNAFAIAAVKLAMKEHCNGHGEAAEIKLLVIESGGLLDPVSLEKEKEVARQVAANPQVLAYIGPMFSEQAKVSIPILNRAGIAQISFSASWPGLTRPGFGAGEPGSYYPTGRRTFFRIIPSDEHQAIAAALWAHDLGAERFFLLEGSSTYSRGLAGIFREKVLDFGARVVGHERLPEGVWDEDVIHATVESIAAASPDLLYFTGDQVGPADSKTGSYALVEAVRLRLPEVAVLLPEFLANPALVTRLGDRGEGIYGLSGLGAFDHVDTEIARSFRAAYEGVTQRPPQAMAAHAYEAGHAVCLALENAPERSRLAVLEALEGLGPVSGPIGRWHFTPDGDVSDIGVSGMQIRGGRWRFVRVIYRDEIEH